MEHLDDQRRLVVQDLLDAPEVEALVEQLGRELHAGQGRGRQRLADPLGPLDGRPLEQRESGVGGPGELRLGGAAQRHQRDAA